VQYENYILYSIQNIDLKQVNKVLTDLREVNLTSNLVDFEKLASIRKKLPLAHYINIHLVEPPALTVISELYKQKSLGDEQLKLEYCSTLSHASKLLQVSLTTFELNTYLDNLENCFLP
jgi:hypothetical protein